MRDEFPDTDRAAVPAPADEPTVGQTDEDRLIGEDAEPEWDRASSAIDRGVSEADAIEQALPAPFDDDERD
jgi:hypothetical protein